MNSSLTSSMVNPLNLTIDTTYGIAMLPTSSSGWEYVMRTNQFIGLMLSGVYINPLSGRIYSVFPSAYGWGNGDDVFLIQDSCIKGGCIVTGKQIGRAHV